MSSTTDHIIDTMNAERDQSRRLSGPITMRSADTKQFVTALENAKYWLATYVFKHNAKPQPCTAPRMAHEWLMHGAKKS